MKTAINWTAAALLALLLSTSYLLDGPDDIATAQAVAADLQDAQAQAKAITQTATYSVAAPALSTGSNAKAGIILASSKQAKAVQP